MFIHTNKSLEKKQIYILIFIHRITPKTMQDLTFFLQKNNFSLKRITKNFAKKDFVLNFTNSNFILESTCDITSHQLQDILFFLKKHTNINGIFFKNQVLNLERIANFKEQPKFNLWKQIHNLVI